MKVYGTRNYGIKIRVQLSLRKKDMKKKKSLSVEMGHNTNSISYN